MTDGYPSLDLDQLRLIESYLRFCVGRWDGDLLAALEHGKAPAASARSLAGVDLSDVANEIDLTPEQAAAAIGELKTAGLVQVSDDGTLEFATHDEAADPLAPGWRLVRQIAAEWKRSGKPRYVLSSSMASLLVATKAPEVTDETLIAPYEVMLVEVPGEWSSMPGSGPLFVLLAQMQGCSAVVAARRFDRGVAVGPDQRRHGVNLPDVCVRAFSARALSETGRGLMTHTAGAVPAYFTEAVRYLINTCCFVTAHNECAPRRTGKHAPRDAAIHDVKPPLTVSVTADFRRYAQQLVSDRRIAERKEALLHVVRGHWKRQVKGSGRGERALIWIHPYQRGTDSLGRIVEKTIRVSDEAARVTHDQEG